MAATTSGALKAWIEAGSLSISAYRDEAPHDASLPYAVIFEAISIVPNGIDNPNDRDAAVGTDKQSVNELVQVSLWQQWKKDDGTGVVESTSLPDALHRRLDGVGLADTGSGAPPTHVWGVTVVSRLRLPPDPDANRVQHVYTLEVIRDT